tara:strand:+ start:1825 stop:3192 length:1368 start_codon:yes stop_codon:yes gene_type:complete
MVTVDQGLAGLYYKGDVSHGEIVLPVTGNQLRKNFLSPLVILAGKGGAYDGEKSFNESKVTLKITGSSDPIVRFEEFDVKQPRQGTAAAASASASTALTVDATIAPFIRQYDVLHFPVENINVRVTAGAGTTSLTIERPLGVFDIGGTVTPGGVTANSDVTIPINAVFVKLSRAVPDQSTTLGERPYNAVEERSAATQICRSDLTQSGRRVVQEKNDRTKQTTLDQRKQQEIFYLMEEAEYNALYSKMTRDSKGRVNTATASFSTGATAGKYTTSDGIFNVIETYAPDNVLAPAADLGQANANLTLALISAYKKTMDQAVGSTKDYYHFVGADLFEKVGNIGNEITGINYNIPFAESGKDGSTGRHVKTISTQFGPMTFMYHPLLDVVNYNQVILSINPDRIQLIAVKGRELKWVSNSQDNDFDGISGYYLSDMGVLIAYATEHFILEGINLTDV